MDSAKQSIVIRRYRIADIDAITQSVENFLKENRQKDYENHYKSLDIDVKKMHNELIVRQSDPDFFLNVVTADENVVGGLCAMVLQPFYSSSRIAYDQLLYMDPSFHNVKAIMKLIQSYVTWAQWRKVNEVRLCSSTGYNQKAFTMLCQRAGFKQFEVGFSRRF